MHILQSCIFGPTVSKAVNYYCMGCFRCLCMRKILKYILCSFLMCPKSVKRKLLIKIIYSLPPWFLSLLLELSFCPLWIPAVLSFSLLLSHCHLFPQSLCWLERFIHGSNSVSWWNVNNVHVSQGQLAGHTWIHWEHISLHCCLSFASLFHLSMTKNHSTVCSPKYKYALTSVATSNSTPMILLNFSHSSFADISSSFFPQPG